MDCRETQPHPFHSAPVPQSTWLVSPLFLQCFFVSLPGFSIEADKQHSFQLPVAGQRLLCFLHSYLGRLFFRKTVDTGADCRKGNGSQVIFPGEPEAIPVTAGQQFLFP
jgi:hypothetical protein